MNCLDSGSVLFLLSEWYTEPGLAEDDFSRGIAEMNLSSQ